MDRPIEININALRPVTTSGLVTFASPSATGATVNVPVATSAQIQNEKAGRASKSKIENAVLSHVRALRTLGKTEVTVGVVSKALGLRESDVLEAITSLSRKGVKLK